MLTEVRKYTRLIRNYFLLNLSAAMEYRASFIIQTLGMALNNASFIFFWWIVFGNTGSGSIGSYKFEDVMTIWAIASASFGAASILFGNVRNISGLIIRGELDVYLLQPKNVLISLVCSKSSISAWGDLLYGFTLFLGIHGFNPGKLLLFTLFVATGAIFFTSVMITMHSLTFWLGDSSNIANAALEFMISFSIYPEDIFKGHVKFIIYSVLPAGFLTFLPLRIINIFNSKALLLILAVNIAYLAVACLVFHRGLRKYESGNLITTRM
jgi:ABC-2 type transport system permease protein